MFQTLGREIGERWKRLNYDEKAFPALALECLTAARLHERFDASELVEWMCTSDTAPTQTEQGTFGEPPIVVYRGRRFYIEVIFWLDGTTAVHQHGFSGAFGVLAGESVETSYALHPVRRINSRMLVCEVVPESVRLLKAGAVEDIVAGEAGAHSLFHLARPSVSIVVRTVSEVEAQPQYQYFRPHLAIDPFTADPIIDRRTRALRALLTTGNPRFDAVAAAAIDAADLELTYHLLEMIHAAEGASERYRALAARASSAHGDVIAKFAAVHAERARERSIIALRAKIHDADHRFFLALLLNVPVRAMVVDLVRQRFPGEDPEVKIETWLRELSGADGIGVDVDEMTIALFRLLSVPRSFDDVLDRINAEVEAGAYKTTGRRVMQQYGFLRDSWLLRPLIAR
jgi:hypothetical protein